MSEQQIERFRHLIQARLSQYTIVLAVALVMALTMSFPAGAFAVEAPLSAAAVSSLEWETADFTYGWWTANYEDEDTYYRKVDIHPVSDTSDRLSIKVRAVTGFSETGVAKLEAGLTDLVLPVTDGQGNEIRAVGDSAFSATEVDKLLSSDKKGTLITSVEFPEGAMAPFDPSRDVRVAENWSETATERGDFWIGSSAFARQGIQGKLVLPEGVIYIGSSAFTRNPNLTEVEFPTTVTWICATAFGFVDTSQLQPMGNITAISFPDETIFPVQMALQCFAGNKIQSAQLPSTTSYLNALSFLGNTGSGEVVVPGKRANVNTVASKGSVVKLFVADRGKLGRSINDKTSFNSESEAGVQEVLQGFAPSEHTPWAAQHFTFSGDGSTVIGLSEAGKAKLACTTQLVVPSKGPNGQDVNAIGEGASAAQGVFSFIDEGVMRQPDSVILPASLQSIGKWAFAATGMSRLIIPASVTTVDADAFAGALDGESKVLLLSSSVSQIRAVADFEGVVSQGSGHRVVGDFSRAAIDPVSEQMLIGGVAEPPAVVRYCGVELVEGADYTVSYQNNTEAGTAHVIAEGVGSFVGQTTRSFSIVEPLVLEEGDVQGISASYDYTGDPIRPVVTVIHDGVTLVEGTDYEVVYGENTVPGEASGSVTVTGRGLCAGTVTICFNIAALTDKWLPSDFTYAAAADGGAVVTGLTKVGKARIKINSRIAIPAATPEGKSVTEIADGTEAMGVLCFMEDGFIFDPESQESYDHLIAPTGLVLPTTVHTIGDWAFAGHHFTELDVPSNVRTIGQGAFSANTAFGQPTLSVLLLHEGVESIGANAFAGAKLQSVSVPISLTLLDASAFAGNASGQGDGKVVLSVLAEGQRDGSGVYTGFAAEGIGHTVMAASDAWGPEDFIYEGAVVIGLSPSGESKLKMKSGALEIPDANVDGTVTTVIGEGAFSTADPNKAGTFGFRANGEWIYPVTVKLPAQLQEIRKGAFSAVYEAQLAQDESGSEKTVERVIGGLSEVDLPETLTTIGEAAFNWAPLTEVTIPDSVTSIGNAAFSAAQTLPGTLTYAKLPAGIEVIPEYLFNNQELTRIDIPGNVKTIERGAFRNNPIETIVFPDGVQSIGEYAFQGHRLTELAIPGSVRTIGAYAFNVPGHNGGSLAKLTLAEGVQSIGERAFQGASLSEVAIPTTLKEMKTRAFNNNKNAAREDSRVILKSKVYHQAKSMGAYGAFIADEVFTAHHGGGHLTVLDFAGGQASVAGVPDQEFANGNPVQPAVSLSWTDPDGAKHELVAESDYKVTYSNNTDAGVTARADIAGQGVFVGELSVEFKIKNAPSAIDPELGPESTPNRAQQNGADGTPLGKGASAEAAEAAILAAASDEGPAGSRFGVVQLRSTKQAKSSITLKWAKVKGAKTYVVYAGKCSEKGMQRVKAQTKNSFVLKKVLGEKVAKGACYKAMVVALDKNDDVISASKSVHVFAKGGKKGNPAKVTTKAKKGKVALKKGKSFKLAGKQVVAKGVKFGNHRALKYESSNAKIATVSKKGVIRAKKKGWCYVYAYAQNGVFAKVVLRVR